MENKVVNQFPRYVDGLGPDTARPRREVARFGPRHQSAHLLQVEGFAFGRE